MYFVILGMQQLRQKKLTVLNILLVLAIVTFFVVSVNLYKNSIFNLKHVNDTYSTIAVMELYGNVDRQGKLCTFENEDCIGYKSVGVKGYDLSQITSAVGVTDYDLREKSAACIWGQPAIDGSHDVSAIQYDYDIIRFTLCEEEPFKIPIILEQSSESNYKEKIYINIIDNALSDIYTYDNIDFQCKGIKLRSTSIYKQEIEQLNRSSEILDTVILYPGIEYIAMTKIGRTFRSSNRTGNKLVATSRILEPGSIDYFGEDFRVYYYDLGEGITYSRFSEVEQQQPFPIMRWEDVQSDPIQKSLWESAWQATQYNACAFTVCLTDDIMGIPLFHLGGGSLVEGRLITEEEYTTGAKVCMISDTMASNQKWHIGDKVNMSFFHYEAFPNSIKGTWEGIQPVYHKKTEGFYDSGVFEIVGIIEKRSIPWNPGISETTMALTADTIYIPHNSVHNTLPQKELPVHGALLTIWLENGRIDDFLADMDTKGITERKTDRYNPTFTFYDQGYSVIQPSLQKMHSTATLLLFLSSLLLVITCVLLAYFFAQYQRQSIGIFRMLGGKKVQVCLTIFICTTLLAVVGIVLGVVVGCALSERVGETILFDSVAENEKFAALRAYVLTTEEINVSAFDIQADIRLSILAGTAVMLFPLLTIAFVANYYSKDTIAFLKKNKNIG